MWNSAATNAVKLWLEPHAASADDTTSADDNVGDATDADAGDVADVAAASLLRHYPDFAATPSLWGNGNNAGNPLIAGPCECPNNVWFADMSGVRPSSVWFAGH